MYPPWWVGSFAVEVRTLSDLGVETRGWSSWSLINAVPAEVDTKLKNGNGSLHCDEQLMILQILTMEMDLLMMWKISTDL